MIWKKEQIPESFKESLIYPIYKKGDPKSPSNYRGIAFINTIAKIFTKILYKRIEKHVMDNGILSESQFGFRLGYSTIDAVYALK